MRQDLTRGHNVHLVLQVEEVIGQQAQIVGHILPHTQTHTQCGIQEQAVFPSQTTMDRNNGNTIAELGKFM